jgi:hypothetical protein
LADNDVAVANWEERSRRLLDLLEPVTLTVLYVYSVLSWIWGLVFGVVAATQCKLDANKRVGKICLILALVNFVLIVCLVTAYIILLVFLGLGLYTLLASPSGGA